MSFLDLKALMADLKQVYAAVDEPSAYGRSTESRPVLGVFPILIGLGTEITITSLFILLPPIFLFPIVYDQNVQLNSKSLPFS